MEEREIFKLSTRRLRSFICEDVHNAITSESSVWPTPSMLPSLREFVTVSRIKMTILERCVGNYFINRLEGS